MMQHGFFFHRAFVTHHKEAWKKCFFQPCSLAISETPAQPCKLHSFSLPVPSRILRCVRRPVPGVNWLRVIVLTLRLSLIEAPAK